MKNRPKPNRAAYASNGTNFVKKSTDIPPLETAAQTPVEPTKAELEKHVEQRNLKVRVNKQDATKAEIINPEDGKDLD